MFGEDPKVGLTSSSLPPEILERLQSEDDLLALHHPPNTATTCTFDEINEPPPATSEPPPPPATSEPPPPVTTEPPSLACIQPSTSSQVPSRSTALLDKRHADIALQRKRARTSQLSQAERMVGWSSASVLS